MTADTSWYGQQTLVHPDYSHEPYAAYEDPAAGSQAWGYPEQQAYGYYADHQDPYAQQYTAAYPAHAPQAPQTHGWPEYYAQHPEPTYQPTLVAEYAGHTGYAGYADHGGYGYDAAHGYAAHDYADHDYGVYAAVTEAAFPAVPEQIPWDLAATTSLPEFDAGIPLPGHDSTTLADETAAASAAAAPAKAAGAAGADHAETEAEADPAEDWTARSSRRRPVRRRSAVLTIAVPSVAVLGVAGAAAATIGPLRSHHTATTASADTSAQSKAQTLAAQEARDAAERAARDQARTALQLRNAAARKTAAEAPVYTLPIAYHSGLSALFGQAGTHWMQLHTGIDFPVPVGTPVHAVTGGTVTTEWNPFYGYMVKLTAPDGTVTWYCHLSSYRVRSGHVKVGDIIAYSGDTGNSTGPHLHFEVHPDGGPAVDPLPWLLARGLDPR